MAVDLILGLGNPGAQYVGTRHNVGFEVVAEVSRRWGRGKWIERFSCDLAVVAPGRMVVIARPLSYMNRSGTAARRLLAELDIRAEDMLVVVDDVDLPLGALRLRFSGGPGTHNGLRDLCDALGTGFPRLRVGVGGGDPELDLAEHVLSPFSPDEQPLAAAAVRRASDAVEVAIREGLERAMNTYNRPPGADEMRVKSQELRVKS
jgi:PTH1 family peptidyl-tRNA hydrolase